MMQQTTTHKTDDRQVPRFRTIKQAAAETGISVYRLRTWYAEGRLPGFAAGNRWMIDVPRLLDQLREPEERCD